MREDPYIIAVDFDGTIVTHRFPNIGMPIGRSVEILRSLQGDWGYQLVLWTCRCGADLGEAVSWCKDRELVFDAVNSNAVGTPGFAVPKVLADFYIDDHSILWRVNGNKNFTPEIWEELYTFLVNKCSPAQTDWKDASGFGF